MTAKNSSVLSAAPPDQVQRVELEEDGQHRIEHICSMQAAYIHLVT